MKVTAAEFDAVAARRGLTLFDLWGPDCAPCRTLAPILEDMAADFAGDLAVCAIDVTAKDGLRERLAARALPTLLLYRDGAEIDRVIGLSTRSRLTAWVEAHL